MRVAAVGSELEPSTDLNTPMLAALIARDGGIAERHPPLPDDEAAIRDFLGRPGADLVILCGGSGLGTNDLTAQALAGAGTLAIHGIALRPADTIALGEAAGTPVAILPGGTAACLCAYEVGGGQGGAPAGGRLSGLPLHPPPAGTPPARSSPPAAGWISAGSA